MDGAGRGGPMTQPCFETQIERLRVRFGKNAFDPEICVLIGIECRNLSDADFFDLVSTLIGTRAHNRPPLVTDFRELRLQIEKRALAQKLDSASTAFKKSDAKIEDVLERQGFLGCRSLHEAIQNEAKKLRIIKQDDPKEGA